WPVSPLCAAVTYSSAVTSYPWRRFLLWSAAGQVLWVGIYVSLGRLFSDSVQDVADIAGNAGLALAALAFAVGAGWLLRHELRRAVRRARERRRRAVDA